ncbi:uncharacterized protein LOC133194639 [Saccostrea echinata]|uniref:uncharacterized protein LOC133194639 n=1 Tax=Saccostrea echinata TaxID=191078 RepID=UPI002A81874C|nr:uncharacterized protein LOC133194639 [Saccostrea echinata]
MTCEDNLGMCGGHPCGNGTCTNNCVSFSCTCFSGYNGNQCEFVNKNARLVEGCNLEVYGLLTALIVSLLIHCGFLTMYFLRLRRKRKDISTGTTPEYANVKTGKASTDHPNQEKTSTEINIYYEALHNNTSVQDAHNYASLVK